MARFLAAGLIGLAFLSITAGRAEAVSEAAAPSLIIPPGARADALGQSYVAIADDPTAIYWNPAGLAGLKRQAVTFMHSQLIPELAPDVYYEYLGYTHEVKGLGTLGLSVVYLTYGSWQATSAEGADLGTYSSYEISIAASYGAKLHEDLWGGLNVKWIRESLVPATLNDLEEGVGTSFAVDFGVLYKTFSDRLRVGAAISNVGPALTFIDANQKAPLPRNFRMGVAGDIWRTQSFRLLGTFELNKPLIGMLDDFGDFMKRDRTLNGGLEGNVGDFLALRWGRIHDPQGDIQGNTWGGGIAIKNLGFRFDYATVPKAEGIGREDKFSLSKTF